LAAAAGFHLFFAIYGTNRKERKWVEGNGLQEAASGAINGHGIGGNSFGWKESFSL
jgi:hypothetical protein